MAQTVASAGEEGGERKPLAARSGLAGCAMVLAAAALATAPLVVRGTSCGHDFDFHLVSWMDALASWRHGIVYPQWAASPNYAAGEARFVFYPPLTWMLGAVLGAVLPWAAVPAALVFALLAGTGLATRALARQAMEDGPAALAGCVAIFSGYALFTVYERSAYAELAGGIWIPLMLLLALRDERATAGRRAFGGTATLLALVVAGAWLSNAPVGVMASYLLMAVALARAAIERAWAPLARSVAGLALGTGLAAFYLVPAAWEQRWVDIGEALNDAGERIENSFLFGHHADPQMAMHDAELGRLSWIALAMIGLALAAVLVSWRRGRLPGARRWWMPLALIPAGVLVLLLPVSLPVWNALPKMRFLQFPWRWLVALEAPLGIFAASAVWTTARARRWAVVAACAAACVGMTVLAGRVYFTVCYVEDAVPGMLAAYRAGTGFDGTDEYAPEDADDSLVAMGLPDACLVSDAREKLGVAQGDLQPQWTAAQGSCEETFGFAPGGNAEHWRVRGTVARGTVARETVAEDGYLVLRLREYPAWRVRVNGRSVAKLPRREDGLLAVPVAAGPVDVAVDWTATRDVETGRAITVAALALVVGMIAGSSALQRRRSHAHLS